MSNLFLNLMESTGKIIKSGELEIFNDNTAKYTTEQGILALEYIEETEQVLLYIFVNTLPENATDHELKAIYEELLEGQAFFMRTAGASLSIQKASSSIFLQKLVYLPHFEASSLYELLADMMNIAEYWEIRSSEIIKQIVEVKSDNTENNSTENVFLNNELLRV